MSKAGTMQRRSFPLVRTLLLGLLGLLLVWQIGSRSLVAYLAEVAPESAIKLRSSDAEVLLNLAEKELRLHQTENAHIAESEPEHSAFLAAVERIRSRSKKALDEDPLNARAFRILGELAAVEENKPHASKLMQAAVERSLRESTAVYWLMKDSYEGSDYGTAANFADLLLRTRPQIIADVMPLLARMAELKEGSASIRRLLRGNPPWRAKFFAALPASVSDARTPLELLLDLKDTPAPPMAADLEVYLNFLVSRKFYEIAYYTWLQFLPPEQLGSLGLLFNGNFEVAPSGLPFDWALPPGAGVTADILPQPDEGGKRALFIEFGYGRVEFKPVAELVMLSPGPHKFEGAYRGELIGRRGLQWRIECAGGNQPPLGQSPAALGATRVWKAFDFEFTVPSQGCRAQYVSLSLDARSASEQLISGSMWYRDLRIDRLVTNVVSQ